MKKLAIWAVVFLILSAIFFFEKEIIFGTVLYSRAFVAGLSQSKEIAVVPEDLVFVEPALPEVVAEEVEVAPEVIEEKSFDSVQDKQNQIDDILEKIDVLKRQLADLEATLALENLPEVEEIIEIELAEEEMAPIVLTQQPVVVASAGGGMAYLGLLISEVVIGGEHDAKNEYVELYNPHAVEIDLTSWYLQRKTKAAENFTTFAPNTLFSGKKIAPNGYFLIARKDSIFSGQADILTTHPLTDDNTLALKNPNGEIADKVGWGLAEDKEGLPGPAPVPGRAIGRSKDQQDTGNNGVDFIMNILSPRAENVAYVEVQDEPEVPAEVVLPPIEVVVPLENIMIYEVQTEGETVNDEFVKLYNPNDVAVDLEEFSLKKKTASGSESNLVSSGAFLGIIGPQGYFLIAPQDNEDGTKNYMGLALPDLRYSGKTFSIADTNTILLYSADEELLDEVVAPYTPIPAPAPEPEPEPESESEPESEPEPPAEPPAPQSSVIINEIAWMGTEISASNEWLELFNPGDVDVDLAGWTLKSADGTPEITLTGTITAHGFYLLERTDDETVPEITADQIYTGALGNDGENILLQDTSGAIIDQVDSVPWPAGDNETKQTMQRVNATTWQHSPSPGGTPRS